MFLYKHPQFRDLCNRMQWCRIHPYHEPQCPLSLSLCVCPPATSGCPVPALCLLPAPGSQTLKHISDTAAGPDSDTCPFTIFRFFLSLQLFCSAWNWKDRGQEKQSAGCGDRRLQAGLAWPVSGLLGAAWALADVSTLMHHIIQQLFTG